MIYEDRFSLHICKYKSLNHASEFQLDLILMIFLPYIVGFAS